MEEKEQGTSWANSCLFCTKECRPKYRIGKNGKLIMERDKGNLPDNIGTIPPLDKEEISVEFIVGNILNLPEPKWKDQLTQERNQGLINLLAVCDTCEKTLITCFDLNSRINTLLKILDNGRNQLKTEIFMSGPAHENEKHAFWNFVRKEAISEFLDGSDTSKVPIIVSTFSGANALHLISNSTDENKNKCPISPLPESIPPTLPLIDSSSPTPPLPKSIPLTLPPPQSPPPPEPSPPPPSNDCPWMADDSGWDNESLIVLPDPVKPPPDVITLDDSDDDEWEIDVPNQFDAAKSKLQQKAVVATANSANTNGSEKVGDSTQEKAVPNPKHKPVVKEADLGDNQNVTNEPVRASKNSDQTVKLPPNQTGNELDRSSKTCDPTVKLTNAQNQSLGAKPQIEEREIRIPRKRNLTEAELACFSPHFAASHRDNLVYKCTECSAFFSIPGVYRTHVATHNAMDVMKDCDKCGWRVKNACMKAHMDYVHANPPSEKPPTITATNPLSNNPTQAKPALLEPPQDKGMTVKPFQIGSKRPLSQTVSYHPSYPRPQSGSRPLLENPQLSKMSRIAHSPLRAPSPSADPQQNVYRPTPTFQLQPVQGQMFLGNMFPRPPTVPIPNNQWNQPIVTPVPTPLVNTFAEDPRLAKRRLSDTPLVAAPLPVPAPEPAPLPVPAQVISQSCWVPAEKYSANLQLQPFDVRRALPVDVIAFPPHVAQRFLGKFIYKCKLCPRFYLSKMDFNASGHATLHYINDGITCPCCKWMLNRFERRSHEQEYHEGPKQPKPIYLNW